MNQLVQATSPTQTLNRIVVVDALIAAIYGGLLFATPMDSTQKLVMFALYSFGLLVLWMIYRQKNWARRTYILLTVLVIATLPSTFVPSARTTNLTSQTFPVFSYVLDVFNFFFTILFSTVLLNPGIRSLFISAPPRRGQRITLGIVTGVAVLVGLASALLSL